LSYEHWRSPLRGRLDDTIVPPQLDSFWYEEAEKAFTEVTKIDPNCGMGYWESP